VTDGAPVPGRLGNYVVERRLGSGGQADVFLARDVVLRRPVALRILHPSEDDAANLRAVEEARLVATLDHPGIVRVHHVERVGGVWAIAMEYVDGESLEARVEREGPMTAAAALRVVAAVADALEHAHRIGVVHRDVKPQNILVRPDLSAVLVDFGIARDSLRPVSLTRTGARVGTPGYMAPEQLAGRVGEIGARTDVFALGLVLWRGLFGPDLFASEEELKRYAARARALLPPSAQELGPQLRGVLYRALEPQVRHRYASAGEFSDDLRSLLSDRPVTAQAPGALVRFGRTPLGRRLFLSSVGAGLFGTGYFLAKERAPLLLTIDAMNRGGKGWIGAREDLGSSVCSGPQEVDAGDHVIHYTYDDRIHPNAVEARRLGCIPWKVTKSLHIDAARRHHRVTILSIACGELDEHGDPIRDPNAPRNVRYGERWNQDLPGCLLRLGSGLDKADFAVVEQCNHWAKRVSPGYYWVNPGKFHIEAFGPNGEHESISGVQCDPWQRTEVVLLHNYCLPKHADRFQLTWGNIFAPRPKELHLEYSDGWVEWLNQQHEGQGLDAEFHIHAALVPALKNEFLSVELSITAPTGRRFRSGVMSLRLFARRADYSPQDERIEFELDGALERRHRNRNEMLVVLLEDANEADPINAATRAKLEEDFGDILRLPLPAEGISKLLLRYTVRARREPQDFGSVEFAGGYLGPHSGKHHAKLQNTGLAFRAELVPRA
jgi:tRNA A-37 threonylcarbamoyl transferase component Bud32